jgi:hypothetical protein
MTPGNWKCRDARSNCMYGSIASDCDGEVDRLCVGDVINDRGLKWFDCTPANISQYVAAAQG